MIFSQAMAQKSPKRNWCLQRCKTNVNMSVLRDIILQHLHTKQRPTLPLQRGQRSVQLGLPVPAGHWPWLCVLAAQCLGRPHTRRCSGTQLHTTAAQCSLHNKHAPAISKCLADSNALGWCSHLAPMAESARCLSSYFQTMHGPVLACTQHCKAA